MIAIVGLSHRTAPVEIREKLAVPASEISARLEELRQRTQAGEMVLLSTCNRVEILAAPNPGGDSVAALATRIVEALERDVPGVGSHAFVHVETAGIEHLFRVAASLDSLVVGEPQILGQLKDAFGAARDAKTLGPWLHRAFEHAFRVAKRVRTETALGAGQVSIPTVAVDLAKEIFGDLAKRRVALVGTGEMATLVATLLGRAGTETHVAGRTPAHVQSLAQKLGATPRTWDDLPALLAESDIVITSTSAKHHVITQAHLSGARKKRHGRPLFLVDLAVPRDVDPQVADLDGVFLYNVDDLAHVANTALAERRKEAEAAAAIVEQETQAYTRRLHSERITPTVVELRRNFRQVLETEVSTPSVPWISTRNTGPPSAWAWRPGLKSCSMGPPSTYGNGRRMKRVATCTPTYSSPLLVLCSTWIVQPRRRQPTRIQPRRSGERRCWTFRSGKEPLLDELGRIPLLLV